MSVEYGKLRLALVERVKKDMTVGKGPIRVKRVPQRTCIACREIKAKREMVRIVRIPGGSVEIDYMGKKSGRGAYLCKTRSCWEAGLRGDRLEHVLKTQMSPENRQKLMEFLSTIPDIRER